MSELVSIVIPVYQAEKYLTKCLDSVMAQTYSDIEVILVDDGSTDGSGRICDEYAVRDGRIRVIHRANGGLSDARNAGMAEAKGEYIIFVDSDDYVSGRMVETLYSRIRADGSDMAIGGFVYVTEAGERLDVKTDPPIRDCVMTGGDMLVEMERSKSAFHYSVVAWNRLVRLSVHRRVLFPVGRIHEDEFILHRLLNGCGRISCVPEVTYYYVQHEGGITHTRSKFQRLDLAEAYLDRADFGIKNGYGELAVIFSRRAIRIMLEGHENSDPEERDRLRELKIRYNGLFRSLFRLGKGVDKLLFAAFYFSPPVCRRIVQQIENEKYKE